MRRIIGLLVAGAFLLTAAPAQAAVPTCFGREATIVGTAGGDTLMGTSDATDVIVGLGGNDLIHSVEGGDFLCGNSGDDLVQGGTVADHISGGAGDDALNGSGGDDVLDGGEGTDRAAYPGEATVDLRVGTATGPFSGQDTLTGIENLSGTDGGVVFIGDNGKNGLSGSESRDRLTGKGGDDALEGGDLRDRLNGGFGDDILNGGGHGYADVLDGGNGTDTCYVDALDTVRNCEVILQVP
jgi:Ca2+-binding RTX toxin-like protein